MPSTRSFSYTKKETWQELDSELSVKGWTRHVLGKASDDTSSIYGFSLGDTLNKPVIYMEYQIHGGHEWHTVHFGLNFMEFLVNPYDPFKGLVDKLKAKYSFYFIPCVNPYGYLNNVFSNANGVNLNRNFDYEWEASDSGEGGTKGNSPFSEPETQCIKRVVERLRPVMFLDWHTSGNQTTAKTHPTPMRTRNYYELSRDFGRSVEVTIGDSFYVDGLQNGPRSRTWASTVMSKSGFEPICMTPEIGGGMPVDIMSKYSTSMAIMYCYYIMEWMDRRSVPIN